MAIDADINQHLGEALCVTEPVPPMGAHITGIKEYLRGTNPRIASAASMVKTTPPGRGSRLLRIGGGDEIHRRFARPAAGGALVMATGPFDEDDLGVACYHSKTGAVELYLNHLVDGRGEYVVVDSTAGAESFASGMFTRFDLTFLVAEPTRKGVGVYQQWTGYAADYDVAIAVLGNKVTDAADVEFLRDHVGADLLACFGQSAAVRAMDQGRPFDLSALDDADLAVLGRMREAVDAREKDWAKFGRQAAEFHLKNARAWANRAVGEELAAQIDPEFAFGPDAPLPAAT